MGDNLTWRLVLFETCFPFKLQPETELLSYPALDLISLGKHCVSWSPFDIFSLGWEKLLQQLTNFGHNSQNKAPTNWHKHYVQRPLKHWTAFSLPPEILKRNSQTLCVSRLLLLWKGEKGHKAPSTGSLFQQLRGGSLKVEKASSKATSTEKKAPPFVLFAWLAFDGGTPT